MPILDLDRNNHNLFTYAAQDRPRSRALLLCWDLKSSADHRDKTEHTSPLQCPFYIGFQLWSSDPEAIASLSPHLTGSSRAEAQWKTTQLRRPTMTCSYPKRQGLSSGLTLPSARRCSLALTTVLASSLRIHINAN